MDVTTSATACDDELSLKSGVEKSTQSVCRHGDQMLESFELRGFSFQLLTEAVVEPHIRCSRSSANIKFDTFKLERSCTAPAIGIHGAYFDYSSRMSIHVAQTSAALLAPLYALCLELEPAACTIS